MHAVARLFKGRFVRVESMEAGSGVKDSVNIITLGALQVLSGSPGNPGVVNVIIRIRPTDM
jgi:hypothetical protein